MAAGRQAAKRAFERIAYGDEGQDLVEYALLGALVGIASLLIWQLLAGRVGTAYGAADTGTQNLSACTPNPGGSGCP